jgi:hypothetical protein
VQIAAETQTPIVPVAGHQLPGQAIGPGIVVDCSKYLNQIGPIDVSGRTVKVQPGVVLDHLNRAWLFTASSRPMSPLPIGHAGRNARQHLAGAIHRLRQDD